MLAAVTLLAAASASTIAAGLDDPAGATGSTSVTGAAAGATSRTDPVPGGSSSPRSGGGSAPPAGADPVASSPVVEPASASAAVDPSATAAGTSGEVDLLPAGPRTSDQGSPGHPKHPGQIPAGFPTPSSTGVPVGTTLRHYAGPMVVRRPGTVIADALVTGCLVVAAPRVITRDSRIVCGQGRAALYFVQPDDPATPPSQVTDVEIDGTGVATVGLGAKNVIATRLNIHDTGDGVHLGMHSTLQDSYISDLADQPNLHHDDLQTLHGSTASQVRVLHNTLMNLGGNSVYHLGSGDISDFLVADNYINGGHYSIQVADTDAQHGLRFVGNTFGFDYHFAILSTEHRGSAVTFVRNVFVDGSRATPADSRGRGQSGG